MASSDILALDLAGTPVRWADLETAAGYYACRKVVWELGGEHAVLHGGINRASGQRSELRLSSIVAIRGQLRGGRHHRVHVPVDRDMLFSRDRHMCAYCGVRFVQADLEMEHVVPRALGGRTVWENLVAACRPCNQRKGNRTPDSAGMPLLYVPYMPSRHEAFILGNRRILTDQMKFLLAGVPRHSRLWTLT